MTLRRGRRKEIRQASYAIDRRPGYTVLRLLPRKSLAGTDLGLIHGLWDFFDNERRDPSRVIVVLVPSGLLSPQTLAELLGTSDASGGPGSVDVSNRILREENVIQRFIENVRSLDSFVVGAFDGEVALQS